jgi:hypothetical protein
MRALIQVVVVGVICVAAAVGGMHWLMKRDARAARPRELRLPGPEAAHDARDRERTPPATNERSRPVGVFIDRDQFEDGGVGVANHFTGPVHDPHSLRELREAIRVRGRLGLAVLGAELDILHLDAHSSKAEFRQGALLQKNIGFLLMYAGRLAEAAAAFEAAQAFSRSAGGSAREHAELTALLGITSLRRGEIENCVMCVGPSSCIVPIAAEAVHQQQAGSREAIEYFTAYLAERPGDLRVRWLLNLAFMTLGEYPAKVPSPHLIPLETLRSHADVGRFENVAPLAGLTGRGANLAGGSIFDDFTGDGRPDLFTTSLDAELGASLYVNRGDGTFEDRSASAGLADQVYALNVTRADIDNDGDLDVLLLRGAWERKMRLSLLRNRGDGRFDDVTVSAGLAEPISTEAAAWGDYDNDGWVDVFVCGEFIPPIDNLPANQRDPRNRGRLYRNRGDGTFVDVAAAAGVAVEQCAKGSAWSDYDGDGRLDLFVSNYVGPCRLFHNEGDGQFRDVAPALGVTGGATAGFACWFWDYDNDGRLDLFVNENLYSFAEEVAVLSSAPPGRPSHPRLYRNLGADGFRDVTHEVGLDRPVTPMGCNFADIDNDGYLDLYQGTGGMSFEHLVPNRMFKNDAGQRFLDVTLSSGTGHLQKGHGVSFADYDGDGDLDLFVEVGGAVPGDTAYNLLFRNPGHGRHWLKVKLVGTKTNRAAIGARIKAEVKGPDGSTRSVYRTVGNNSSFGGNSLVELIGLGEAMDVAVLEVSWPTSRTTQTFRDLAADRTVEITEGVDAVKPLPALAVAGEAGARGPEGGRKGKGP